MLLNFKCKNFKAFQEGFEFDMQPNTRLTELKYSLLSEKITESEEKALSVSVIYGPNAAGKTTLINAMSCFRQILLKGTIENSEDDRIGDHVSANMELIPFIFADKTEPVKFDILFTHNGRKYQYALSFDLGGFIDKEHKRYISEEKLYVNGALVFERTKNSVDILNLSVIKDDLNKGCDVADGEKYRVIMANNISMQSLILVTDFNSFCSKEIVEDIKEWFINYFIVVNSADRKTFYPTMPDAEGKAMIGTYINKIAREAGIVGSDFAYASDSDSHRMKLVSILKQKNKELLGMDSEKIESVGTLRLIAIMPPILAALQRGAVLVMDEMDASLHPMIIMNIITLFHNDEVNVNRAQLIFNTHNPIYLNHKLLRRDEIKFVEKDKDTKSSTLYALSDFKTNGDISVRKTSDYMKNYFVNRYGAIETIDFTDIIIEMLSQEPSLD